MVAEALLQAGVKESDLSAVAVTIGPGLSLCLRGRSLCCLNMNLVILLRVLRVELSLVNFSVGVKKARSISKIYRLPWIGVHHMEAHALVAR